MDSHSHGPTLKTYYVIFGALMGFTALTVCVAFIDLGPLNTLVAMAIAITKALLVLTFFMHVRYSPKLTQIFAAIGFFWLLIGLALLMADYGSRLWGFVPKGWE